MALKKKTGNKKQSKPLVYVLEGVFGALAMSLGLVAHFSQHCSAHASRKNAVGSRVRSAALSIL